MSEQAPLQTFYDAVGGHETFVALVKRFYEGVASDPPLRALSRARSCFGRRTAPDVPGAVLGRSDHLQRAAWASAAADAPRPFAVTPAMRDRWLKHMRDAIDSIELTPQQELSCGPTWSAPRTRW